MPSNPPSAEAMEETPVSEAGVGEKRDRVRALLVRHRASHETWANARANGLDKDNPDVGDEAFHRQVMAEYDAAIADVDALSISSPSPSPDLLPVDNERANEARQLWKDALESLTRERAESERLRAEVERLTAENKDLHRRIVELKEAIYPVCVKVGDAIVRPSNGRWYVIHSDTGHYLSHDGNWEFTCVNGWFDSFAVARAAAESAQQKAGKAG